MFLVRRADQEATEHQVAGEVEGPRQLAVDAPRDLDLAVGLGAVPEVHLGQREGGGLADDLNGLVA